MGKLAERRSWHGSIELENEVMVIGGWYPGGRLLNFYDYFLIKFFFSDWKTEILNLTNEANKIINPTLKNGDYCNGIGLYLVPFDFCTP